MERVPLEMIERHAFKTVAEFFAKKVEEERKKGKVAVLVEDFTNSLYFMPCDRYGFPNYHNFKYLAFDSFQLQVIKDGAIPTQMTSTVEEIQIMVDKPLLTQRYDWQDKPYVFMWNGRKMGSRKIPLEKMDVSELMKIAQKVIENREGLIIDEVLENKLYK
jgi:hypothetical protein